MYFTHSNKERVSIGSGSRLTDLEVFMRVSPYLNRKLYIHYGSGQRVRVYDESELSVVSRMVAAYYNFELEQDSDVFEDPIFKSSLWNTCLFTQSEDGLGITPVDEARQDIDYATDTANDDDEDEIDQYEGKYRKWRHLFMKSGISI